MGKGGKSGRSEDTKSPMTKSAASRIQSHSDKTGSNKDFARRAQSAADKRADE